MNAEDFTGVAHFTFSGVVMALVHRSVKSEVLEQVYCVFIYNTSC